MLRILGSLLRLLLLIIMHSSTDPIAVYKGNLEELQGPLVQELMPPWPTAKCQLGSIDVCPQRDSLNR